MEATAAPRASFLLCIHPAATRTPRRAPEQNTRAETVWICGTSPESNPPSRRGCVSHWLGPLGPKTGGDKDSLSNVLLRWQNYCTCLRGTLMLYISVTVDRCYRLSCRADECANGNARCYRLHMHCKSYMLPADADGIVYNVAAS